MTTKANGNMTITLKGISMAVLLTLLVYLITGIRNFDKLSTRVEAQEYKIAPIEQWMKEEQKRQPLRDYILEELARKQGIEVPRGLR